MKCSKCGKEINRLNHYYIPSQGGGAGRRYCIKCAREDNIITLV